MNINIGDYAIPLIFAFVCLFALIKRVDLFGEFIRGVEEGLGTVKDIFPSLMALVVSVGMFRSCGGVELVSGFLNRRPASAELYSTNLLALVSVSMLPPSPSRSS